VLTQRRTVGAPEVRDAVRMVMQEPDVDLDEAIDDVLADVGSRRRIGAKTLAQRHYIDLMRKHDVVFAIGPAGTGKTYLAMAMAIAALNRHEVARVVLTRPAVEAGEKLGFLPGTMAEKVNPYSAPALRRARRHDGLREVGRGSSSAARSRWRRSRSCAAARSTTRS
jgi:phosphate starvation-inducible PhoH-like protein